MKQSTAVFLSLIIILNLYSPSRAFAATDASLVQMASLITSLQGIVSSLKSKVANLKSSSSVSTAEAQTASLPPPPDTTPVIIFVSSPVSGLEVSSTITISANVSDYIGISSVQFLLDGLNLGNEDTSSPYSISWDTTTASNGSHTITARARDVANNQALSAGVNITVNNVAPPAALIGDLNSDRIVNSLDWSFMNAAWSTNSATADLNRDGIVNSLDFSLLNANWGRTS